MNNKRFAKIKRKTKETCITGKIFLDGEGNFKIKTPIPFLTHMLEQFSKHSRIDIKLDVTGDIDVDLHHTVEDTGISLGQAIYDALQDKKGINRFGMAYGVLDEALCRVVLDISGRTYISYNVDFLKKTKGEFDVGLIEEFLNGFVRGGKITLHIDKIKGKNNHHIIESVFKGLALALRQAILKEGKNLPSTKGKI